MTNETCDLSLSITSDLIFNSGEKHNYYLEVEDKNCDQMEREVDIEYWIEDLFGEMIKSNYTTTQSITCSKNVSRQWTPGDIEGTEACYIRARIVNSTCNDSEGLNNFAEKFIAVKGGTPDPGPCPSCETTTTETSTCYCGPCPKCESEEETEEEEGTKEFEIISWPEEVRKDEEIEIQLEIKNTSVDQRNYTVYSYVYEGNKILSTGFDGNSWLNTWDANKQNVSIPGNSSVTITLKNRIAEDTKPGKYKLRVRTWTEGKKHDLTKEILVREPLEIPKNQTTEEGNETEYNESESEINIPTGSIISKREENWFPNFMENVINFFKNLFNL